MNETLSIDLVYAIKLADYNEDIKHLIVTVGCMSRFLRVQLLKSNYVMSTAEAFKQKFKIKQTKQIG